MKLNDLKEADKIKISLLKYILKNKSDVIAVPEVSVCNSVADMLVIDQDIHIYEIKSAKDTLQRLPKQIESYKKCANKITLILDEKFLQKIDNLDYLDGVGIISINKRYQLTKIKEPISHSVSKKGLITYWSAIELKETFRGFPKWYKYSTNDALKKLDETLDLNKLSRLTIYRIKEKYRKESYKRKKALQDKDYTTVLKSRFADLDSLEITPLLDVPSSVFIDFI